MTYDVFCQRTRNILHVKRKLEITILVEMGKNKKPKEWKNCPKMCSEPAFGKFVAFKTPYDSGGNFQPTEAFTVSSVFELAEERGMKMGMWFDCTNVDRFYSARDVERNNCVYVKLKCSGRDIKQANSLLNEFKMKCNGFFEKYPGMLIGVHCTHGFNRTGFFIVSYMVDECGWDILAAVNEFARVRPPGIYRKDKLNELSRKYNFKLRGPLVPPPWTQVGVKRQYHDSIKERDSKRVEDIEETHNEWQTVTYRSKKNYNVQSKSNYTQGRRGQEEPGSWRTQTSLPRYFRQF